VPTDEDELYVVGLTGSDCRPVVPEDGMEPAF